MPGITARTVSSPSARSIANDEEERPLRVNPRNRNTWRKNRSARNVHNEIVVDAYGEEERAIGWYTYLEDAISFPFLAVCDIERDASPLAEGERVKALGLAGTEICGREIFVKIAYSGKKTSLAVPLMQLVPDDDVDDDTRKAVEDWRYWMNMGYDF